MNIKIDFKVTFTNFVGAISVLVGLLLMYLEVAGAEAVTVAALGLVATKKVNDMVRKDV